MICLSLACLSMKCQATAPEDFLYLDDDYLKLNGLQNASGIPELRMELVKREKVSVVHIQPLMKYGMEVFKTIFI